MSTPPARKPQGYVGINHETSGRDILSVLKTIHVPEVTLGPELAGRLKRVSPDGWYPIADMLALLEKLDQKLGSFHLKQVGWTIVQSLPPDMLARFQNARELLEAFDGMYHFNNRGEQIGGWKLTSFMPNRAEFEKNTVHHCVMEEGIVEECLRKIGVTAQVSQTTCFRKGGPLCRYVVTPKTPHRWGAA